MWCTPPRAQRQRAVSGSAYFTKEKSMSSITTHPEALFSAAGNLQEIVKDAQAAPVHQVFVSTLSAGGESSATTDAITTG